MARLNRRCLFWRQESAHRSLAKSAMRSDPRVHQRTTCRTVPPMNGQLQIPPRAFFQAQNARKCSNFPCPSIFLAPEARRSSLAATHPLQRFSVLKMLKFAEDFPDFPFFCGPPRKALWALSVAAPPARPKERLTRRGRRVIVLQRNGRQRTSTVCSIKNRYMRRVT